MRCRPAWKARQVWPHHWRTIKAMYAEGRTQKQIALFVGVDVDVLREAERKFKLREAERKREPMLTRNQGKQLELMMLRGWERKDICEELGIDEEALAKVLALRVRRIEGVA